MSLLKKLFMVLGVVVVLFVAAGLLLAIFIDVNDYKTRIEQLAEDNIGRKLTIKGDLELKTFPYIRVKTGELLLANPPGYPRQNMLEIQSAEIGIRLLPLLFKKVEAGTIKFESPVINLTRKSSGEANWEFNTADQSKPKTSSDNSGAALAAFAVQGFDISTAQVNFADLSTDTILKIDEFNLKSGSIVPGTAFPIDITTSIEGSMLANPLQITLSSDITIDANLSSLQSRQFAASIRQMDSSFEISSPEIDFQLDSNLLEINSLALRDTTDTEIQAEMVVEKAAVDLDNLISEMININSSFASEGLNASAVLPRVEFDIEKSSARIASSVVSVLGDDFSTELILPDTSLDLTQPGMVIENLNGKFAVTDLNGTLNIQGITFNRDTLEIDINDIRSRIGQSELRADISGGLAPVSLNYRLDTDNLNLKEILLATGNEIQTSKPGALTQLNLAVIGEFRPDSLTVGQLTGNLDETNIEGNAAIYNFDAPEYALNLNLGDISIDDYLPNAEESAGDSSGETAATAAAAPFALSQLEITADITANRIDSELNGIVIEDLALDIAPMDSQSLISLTGMLSGEAVPEPLNLSMNTSALIDSEKSLVELNDIRLKAAGNTLNAGLDIPLLVAPLSASNIDIENIGVTLTGPDVSSEVNVPSLSYNMTSTSMVAKKISGTGRYSGIDANIILPNLSVALDTQSLKINELALDLRGSKPVGRLSVPNLDVNLTNKTLGPTNIIFEGQDGRAEINIKPSASLNQYTGNLQASDFNLRGILDRFNILTDLQDKSALTRINVQSPLNFSPSGLELKNIKASIDDTSISGYIDASFGDEPVYDFAILIGDLNADRYIPRTPESASAQSTKAVAAPVAIPVGLFRETTASGEVQFDNLIIAGAEFSNFKIGISSADGKLSVSPIDSGFFNGKMNGNLSIDSSETAPRLDFDYKLSDVSLEPALKALGVTEILAGDGDFELDMAATGNTDREMISSVNGFSSINIENGSIKGINLQEILFKGYQTYAELRNKTVDSKYNPADHTEFSSMSGSWTINGGTLSGNDLQIQAPLFRVDGTGQISLVNQSIDYLLNIKIVKSLEGQGGKSMKELEGKTVPLSITGSLSNPQYNLDITTLLQAEAVQKAEQEIQKKLEKELGEELEGEGSLQDKLEKKALDKAGEKLLDLFNRL